MRYQDKFMELASWKITIFTTSTIQFIRGLRGQVFRDRDRGRDQTWSQPRGRGKG